MIMFDDALDVVLGVLKERFPDALPTIHLIRNAFGAIIVVIPDDLLSRADQEALTQTLDTKLGPYSLGLRRLLSEERDIIDPEDVFESPDKVQIPGYPSVFLIDRMVTNQDWARPPLVSAPPIPTLVAFSLTGGVGRSTALAMLAGHLARRGKRVLVIDLDLEEPGIGALLSDTLPAFGVVDWLAECLNGPADGALRDRMSRCVCNPRKHKCHTHVWDTNTQLHFEARQDIYPDTE
jgi:CobQ/CobB/MinD/ParA nucleotide binding domain